MKELVELTTEVKDALNEDGPVVALESTVISHGLPYPTNLDIAQRMEARIRERGAVPATIAVLDGKPRVGVTDRELAFLAEGQGIRKASRRDLPALVAQGGHGATTVAATATIAASVGIEVFATGGIGGVHREPAYDISNDLPTLASVPIAVVCSGAKAILDLRATLEWLETAGVPVIGYATDQFPAFYSRVSGLGVDFRADSAADVAAIIRASHLLSLPTGVLVTVPVPKEDEIPSARLEAAIQTALVQARAQGIGGSATTPFLLEQVAQETGGASLRANVSLLANNAAVGAEIALALATLKRNGASDD